MAERKTPVEQSHGLVVRRLAHALAGRASWFLLSPSVVPLACHKSVLVLPLACTELEHATYHGDIERSRPTKRMKPETRWSVGATELAEKQWDRES